MSPAARLTPARVLRRVNHWKRRLQLAHWKILLEFGPDEADESEASCLAMPEYLQATLRFDLTKIEPDELDAYVIHELSHCVIWGLANAAQSMCGGDPAKLENVRVLEESLATWIERLVVRLTEAP